MRRSAYRTAWVSQEAAVPRSRIGNRDVLPVFVAIWLFSVMRLGMAFEHEEPLGTEPTLMFALVVLIPALLFTKRADG